MTTANTNQKPSAKEPITKRTFDSRGLAVVAAIALALGLCAGLAIMYPIAHSSGHAAGVSENLAEEIKRENAQYRKVKADLADVTQKNNDVHDEYLEALNTISMAKSYKLDELKSERDKLNEEIAAKKKDVEAKKAELAKVSGQVDTAKKNTIGAGVWQVGKDIDAGTYRATADVGSTCYWSISDPKTDNIIQNDLPGGGYPEITVSDGQQLKLSRCGTFVKQ